MDEYAGQVRLVYIHTAFSPRSARAAEAAECAYRQGRFWQYKDRVFERQTFWTRASDWESRLVSYGRDVGLEMDSFERCLASGEIRPAVQADIRAGEVQAIKYTPTIIMNDGSRFVGSDISPLREALEGALRVRGER